MKRYENILGIHERALQVRSQRMDLLAQNLANISTPHFKARDLDFRKMLSEEQQMLQVRMATTHFRHMNNLESVQEGVVLRVPMNASADGNTVEAHVEQAKYGEAAAQFDATIRFLERRVSSIRTALKGE